MDRRNLTGMDWATFQARLEDRLLGKSVINDKKAIDKRVDELTSAIQKNTAPSAPKRQPRAELRPPTRQYSGLSTPEEPVERAAEAVACHKGPHSKSTGQRPPKVGELSAEQVDERTVEGCARILEQCRAVAAEDDKVMRVPSPLLPLQVPEGLAPLLRWLTRRCLHMSTLPQVNRN